MFPKRSADRLSCGPHKAARSRQNPLQWGLRACSSAIISHLQSSVDPTSDAQLIHLKRRARDHRSLARSSLSLPPAERVNVHRQRLDRGGIKTADPGRHYAGTAVGNCLDKRCLIGTIEPDLVGEIWRAELLTAL